MSQQIPDAAHLAAALLPVDEARVYLSECGQAITRMRLELLEAEAKLTEAMRACNRAREALLKHQGRP